MKSFMMRTVKLRTKRKAYKAVILVLFILFTALGAMAQTSGVWTVTTTADSNPFTPVAGTLRWAVVQANASATPSTINFIIPGTGSYTIILSNGSLPVISQSVTIDGTTQAGYSKGNPKITIAGGGLTFQNLSNCIIRGLSFIGMNNSNTNNNFLFLGCSNFIIEDNIFGINTTSVYNSFHLQNISNCQFLGNTFLNFTVYNTYGPGDKDYNSYIENKFYNYCLHIVGSNYNPILRNLFFNITNSPTEGGIHLNGANNYKSVPVFNTVTSLANVTGTSSAGR